MHFRMLEMIVTSGFLAALEFTKFVFGRGSAPDPAKRELIALPRPSNWFKGGPTSKEKGRVEGGKERRGEEGRGWERRGRDRPHPSP